jgi:hypothetical protein
VTGPGLFSFQVVNVPNRSGWVAVVRVLHDVEPYRDLVSGAPWWPSEAEFKEAHIELAREMAARLNVRHAAQRRRIVSKIADQMAAAWRDISFDRPAGREGQK